MRGRLRRVHAPRMRGRITFRWLVILTVFGVSCGDGAAGTQVRMAFELVGEDFFAAPLPSEARDAHSVVGFPTTGAGVMTALFGLLDAPSG